MAVGGKVPVNLRGGSAHCNANVIGLEARVRLKKRRDNQGLRQGRSDAKEYLLRR